MDLQAPRNVRLMSVAGPSEIVSGNTLYHRFPDTVQACFAELDPVDAKNMGRVKAWKWAVGER